MPKHIKDTRKKGNYWHAEYECPYCGNIFEARKSSVNSGNTKSCGCLRKTKPETLSIYEQARRIWINTEPRSKERVQQLHKLAEDNNMTYGAMYRYIREAQREYVLRKKIENEVKKSSLS